MRKEEAPQQPQHVRCETSAKFSNSCEYSQVGYPHGQHGTPSLSQLLLLLSCDFYTDNLPELIISGSWQAKILVS